jgi:hypothetical protein
MTKTVRQKVSQMLLGEIEDLREDEDLAKVESREDHTYVPIDTH